MITMSDKSDSPPPNETPDDPSDTLIVPPPGFRERLRAAQRARKLDSRSTVEIPAVPLKQREAHPDDPDPNKME
jgi:hypothetical protein